MEGTLTFRKDGCVAVLADGYVKVENLQSGCTVVPVKAVCTAWKTNEQRQTVLFELRHFEAVASKGEAEAFAVVEGDWTLQLYRWTETGSYVLEVWHNDFCLTSLEWWNNEDGLTVYVEGDVKALLRFACEKLLKKGVNEQ
jgi:hypothetical protein